MYPPSLTDVSFGGPASFSVAGNDPTGLKGILADLKNKICMNCIIIHGCPRKETDHPEIRTYDKHWIPWTKEQLDKQGISTEVPLMPEPWAPVYERFKEVFEKLHVDENTVLIGHSCGCAFLSRWLAESKQKVSKLIFVAPWKRASEDKPIKKVYYGFTVDPTIKDRVGDIIMFTSYDENPNAQLSLDEYHDALGGKVIDLPDHEHYTFNDMETVEFPELIDAILK